MLLALPPMIPEVPPVYMLRLSQAKYMWCTKMTRGSVHQWATLLPLQPIRRHGALVSVHVKTQMCDHVHALHLTGRRPVSRTLLPVRHSEIRYSDVAAVQT